MKKILLISIPEMKKKNKLPQKVINLIIFVFFLFCSPVNIRSNNYIMKGKVESKRKDNLITILFPHAPSGNEYKVVGKKRKIGDINILSVAFDAYIKKYRVVGNYVLYKKSHNRFIRTGDDIVLMKGREKFKRDFSDPVYVERINYFKRKISIIDGREMVLVPAGKFVFGSNSGDRDEYPEQVVYLNNYYIDKYEVSNMDFKKFMEKTNSPPPSSWENGLYSKESFDLPVLVTYYEARSYAKWAKKRLPGEKEWEKAARGTGDIKKITGNRYPWGMKFMPGKVNSLEFWSNSKTGAHIKNKYYRNSKILPVNAFYNVISQFGTVNMSGNVMEWTSDWYIPYENNYFKNRRYGKQYKVIRGGAFFSNKDKVRVTNRELGGIPNLYNDNIAGFRCIKDTTYLDIENKNR